MVKEEMGGWRELHNKVLHNVYSSDIMVIKSRRVTIQLLAYLPYMGKMKNAYIILFIKPEGKSPFGRKGIDGRIIVKYILKK
jgi:hypothetical protein